VVHQLRTEGVLSDLTKIQALLSVAQRYVITDAGWNLLDFAAQTRNLSTRDLVFHTLPIKGFATIGGQDANVVDPAYLKAIIRAAFHPGPSPGRSQHPTRATARTATVDVLNGGDTAGLAGRVSAALVKAGYRAGRVGNTTHRTSTVIRYGTGAAADASRLAKLLGVTAVASASVASGHAEILLGATAVMPAISTSTTPRTPPAGIPTAGPQGGAVSAKNGIPCVN
jgi:hypothetical protein